MDKAAVKKEIISPEEARRHAVRGRRLLEERQDLLMYWQEIADNFYPEHAVFMGGDTVSGLARRMSGATTSYPMRVNRDLADMLSSSLRPEGKIWARPRVSGVSDESEKILNTKGRELYAMMHHRLSGFSVTMRYADRSHAAFGNAVISCEPEHARGGLIFKSWNIKDVAWEENYDGTVGAVFRSWKPDCRELVSIFGEGGVDRRVVEKAGKQGEAEVQVYHCFMEVEKYMGQSRAGQKKYMSLFYDIDHDHVLKAVETDVRFYSVSRWARIAGSQYGFSPATSVSLSDARLLQMQEMTLIEAGQKAIDPVIVERAGALRGDRQTYAGGSVIIDREYDESLGSAIRTLDIDGRNIPFGLEIIRRTADTIKESHYADLIGLPLGQGGMTPLEISQRTADYLRKGSPILRPLEVEYSADLYDLAWNVATASGFLFKRDEVIPEELQGLEFDFDFVNPLKETEERALANNLAQSLAIIGQTGQFDERIPALVDYFEASRKAVKGIMGDEFMRTEAEIGADVEKTRAAQEQERMMQEAANISSVVKEGSEAALVAADAGDRLMGG